MTTTRKGKTPKPSKPRAVKESPYVPPPADACEEAASRLLVVQRLLLDHIDHCVPPPADSDYENDDGYDITIAVDVIDAIRVLLQTSAEAADATPAAPADGGGAQ